MQKPLARPQIGVLVCLGLGRERAIGRPEIDERLHWLKFLRPEHVKRRRREDEVAEAAIQLLLQVEVVEWLDEVGPVQVSVDAEHLAEDCLADLHKVLGEAAALANPVSLARIRHWKRRDGRIVCIRDARWIRGEDIGVVDLARDPALHKRHVLERRQFDGLPAAVEPGKGVISETVSATLR